MFFNLLFVTGPTAPSATIKTIEFPDDEVLHAGSNVTIECISNFSKAGYGNHYYAQPYWIQLYHNIKLIKDCGGRDGNIDSEDSKVCTFLIQNATEKDSGTYTCWSHNQMACTEDTIKLVFKGKSKHFIHIAKQIDSSVVASKDDRH